jgi:uncharacterized protein YbjQ (UPF0145 family)/AcrR family transcriptional regulator
MTKLKTPRKRRYSSDVRKQAADATRDSILRAARTLFARHGIDRVTIAQIADAAGTAASTVYALYQSKEGILRALMRSTMFGPRFQSVRSMLEGESDPIRLIALSASIARAIYEGESSDLGLLRGSSSFSPALRKIEQEFEATRLDMQEERVRKLFASKRQRKGLDLEEARRILWMYTSRDVYRMLVHESSTRRAGRLTGIRRGWKRRSSTRSSSRDAAKEERMDIKMTTTAFDIHGYRVTRNLGVVRGITVRSRSIFGTVGAGLQTLVGGNITLFTELCEKTRTEAFDMMRQHAQELGANAIVGVRYDATEVMQGVTEVLCYGTAVVVDAV